MKDQAKHNPRKYKITCWCQRPERALESKCKCLPNGKSMWVSLHWFHCTVNARVRVSGADCNGFLGWYCYSRVNQLAHWRHAGLDPFFPAHGTTMSGHLTRIASCQAMQSIQSWHNALLYFVPTQKTKINCKYCHCQVQNPSPSPVQTDDFIVTVHIYLWIDFHNPVPASMAH